MNRICAAFNDIGNINLNYAGVLQFNWQMLMSGPCAGNKPEIPQLFCEMDCSNVSNIIESQNDNYTNEKQLINGYNIVAEDITRELIRRYNSLEAAYPYIVKYLFAGEGQNRSAHKQMFWRIFGDIALANLKKNLSDCDICENCRMRVPSWVKNHQCIKNTKGFYECIDCGLMCERKNSSQCRCEECQEQHRALQKKIRQRAKRDLRKAIEEKRITPLLSYSTET